MKKDEVLLKLKSLLKENSINNIENILEKLNIYYDFLVEYNKNVNLTSITSFEDVFIKHFIDSIANVNIYKNSATLCDIGTGAGFPGMVIKIVRPDLNVVLVDSLNKRITFLELLAQKLNLSNIKFLHYRAEDVEFKNQYLNTFDYVIARAVASMPTLTEYCLPYVRVGGKFVAYKSQSIADELNLAKKCIKMLGGELEDIITYNIANLYDRAQIVVKKVNSTSSAYPRNMNKPKLKPIQ